MVRTSNFTFFILFCAVIVLITSFVSAQQNVYQVRQFFSNVYDNLVVPLFTFLLGPVTDSNSAELFTVKILFFLVVISVIWSVLSKVPLFENKRALLGIVSFSVSLLGVRFLTAQWISGILLPYNTLSIAILTLLPLLIYTYFVYNAIGSKTLQRIAWIVAACVFIALYFLRINELGSELALIYGIAAILCILAVFMNNWINRLLNHLKIEGMYSQANEEIIRNLRRKLHEAHQDFGNGVITQVEYDDTKRKILGKISGLS